VTTPASEELGEILTGLKERSGRSYAWIGTKVHAGKSTVQRYCTGQTVPPEFGMIERIARVCGADTAEVTRLFRLWELAVSSGPVNADDAASVVADAAASVVVDDPAVHVAPPGRTVPRRRRRPAFALLTCALAVVLLLLAGAAGDGANPSPSPAATAQVIPGPAWKLPPSQVPRTLFGVTINSPTGDMPTFDVGAVRLWDSQTRWANIQPGRGEFDWSVLDRLVAGAAAADLPVLFVFGGTPAWANPSAPAGPYADGSRAGPPEELADWGAFVGAVVERYRGRIEGYELWALATDPRFFTGSVATLVDMTARASRIIRTVDPTATVVCPGMGNLWTPEGQDVLRRFAAAGGYDFCDAAGIKLYQRAASDPPETMLDLAATADRLFHEGGVQPRVWSTGTTYAISLDDPLSAEQARNYAVRYFLVGIYARYLNLQRMYFYNWGGTKIPLVLQAVGGQPTDAALAVQQLQRWLTHAQSRSCGHGPPIGLPDHAWQCDFTITDPDRRYDASIRWTDSGNATTPAGAGAVAVHRLDGATTAVQPGDTITIGEEPVLIEQH